MIRVRANQSALQRQLARTEGATRAALRRTLNRVGQQSFTLTLRRLSKATGVSQRKLREYVSLNRADYFDLSSAVKIRAHTFNVASVGTSRQTRIGVTSGAWGRRQTYRGAFLIRGGITAMHRVGKKRLPIEPVWGPRITREFDRENVDDDLKSLVGMRFGPTMKHELDFALGRIGMRT